ncbi:MAG: hypothetical protein JW716_02435 [Candidatus Aenigmarchaeota archaeon]|nr:hypothetical protein [Candidatus Aenigmarchaeota archaeon]
MENTLDLSKIDTTFNGSSCPRCKSERIFTYRTEDHAFSCHYIRDISEYGCGNCKHVWVGEASYNGLA